MDRRVVEWPLTGRPDGVWVHEYLLKDVTFELGAGRDSSPQFSIVPTCPLT